jgi:hypothetical protein
MNVLKLFSFDLLAFLNLGCVMEYTFYSKWVMGFFLMPALVAIVFVIYTYKQRSTMAEPRVEVDRATDTLDIPDPQEGTGTNTLDTQEARLTKAQLSARCIKMAEFSVFLGMLFRILSFCLP